MVILLALSSSDTKQSTISRVKPSTNMKKAESKAPNTMYGLRRPHFDLDSSAIAPTMGWTMRPDKGPAIHTRDVFDLVRPRESR